MLRPGCIRFVKLRRSGSRRFTAALFACRIAAQVELKLEQTDSARGYLRECERLCSAIQQGWSPIGGLGSFVEMLEARAGELRSAADGGGAAALQQKQTGSPATGANALPLGGGETPLDADAARAQDRPPEAPPAVLEQALRRWVNNPFRRCDRVAQASGLKLRGNRQGDRVSAQQPGAAHPLDDIASAHGSAARQAVHDACAQAVGFACETEPPNTFEFPPRLVHGGQSTPELEGQVRNSVRRFAEQVLRIEQSSQGEGEARRLVLSRPSDYNLPLDEDPNVRKCVACGTLGGAGVLFTSTQFQRVRPRCKPCTQRRALEAKRAQVE